MAKKEQDLLQTLRASGLRKKVARSVTKSASRSRSGGAPRRLVEETVRLLRDAATTLEDHTGRPGRREAAKKAARTRKRNAEKRSAAAKKAARTRARGR